MSDLSKIEFSGEFSKLINWKEAPHSATHLLLEVNPIAGVFNFIWEKISHTGEILQYENGKWVEHSDASKAFSYRLKRSPYQVNDRNRDILRSLSESYDPRIPDFYNRYSNVDDMNGSVFQTLRHEVLRRVPISENPFSRELVNPLPMWIDEMGPIDQINVDIDPVPAPAPVAPVLREPSWVVNWSLAPENTTHAQVTYSNGQVIRNGWTNGVPIYEGLWEQHSADGDVYCFNNGSWNFLLSKVGMETGALLRFMSDRVAFNAEP